MIETNNIKEIFKGHYQLILDFPDKIDLYKIIDKSYQFVWGIEHTENHLEWSEYKHTLYGAHLKEVPILARNMSMEFLLKTEDFEKYIPYISQSIRLIQTNIKPPYYLDLKKLQGKPKYDLLKAKIGYLYEIDMPAAVDYTSIVSPDKFFLEAVINRFL